jgi:hypothetical protein
MIINNTTHYSLISTFTIVIIILKILITLLVTSLFKIQNFNVRKIEMTDINWIKCENNNELKVRN